MTEPVTRESSAEAFLEEHRELMREIAGLQTLWSEVDQIGRGPRFAEMSHGVRTLRDTLAHHFQEEERDGYLATALERAPRFSELADSLRAEHERFLQRLDAFLIKLDECGFDCWREVGDEFDGFVSELRKHETEENRIMHSAFNEDIGNCD